MIIPLSIGNLSVKASRRIRRSNRSLDGLKLSITNGVDGERAREARRWPVKPALAARPETMIWAWACLVWLMEGRGGRGDRGEWSVVDVEKKKWGFESCCFGKERRGLGLFGNINVKQNRSVLILPEILKVWWVRSGGFKTWIVIYKNNYIVILIT